MLLVLQFPESLVSLWKNRLNGKRCCKEAHMVPYLSIPISTGIPQLNSQILLIQKSKGSICWVAKCWLDFKKAISSFMEYNDPQTSHGRFCLLRT